MCFLIIDGYKDIMKKVLLLKRAETYMADKYMRVMQLKLGLLC